MPTNQRFSRSRPIRLHAKRVRACVAPVAAATVVTIGVMISSGTAAARTTVHATPHACCDLFGALAYSPPDGTYGGSFDQSNGASAADYAIGDCFGEGGTACKLVLDIENGWGALAISVSNEAIYGTGGAPLFPRDAGAREAESNALQACDNEAGGSGCAIAVVFSSDCGPQMPPFTGACIPGTSIDGRKFRLGRTP